MATTHAGKDLLLTYGWMFMVVIAALITLKLFGFFEDAPPVPECVIDSEFICRDFQIYKKDNALIMSLTNNFGGNISEIYMTLPECKCLINKSNIRDKEQFNFIVKDCRLLESKSRIPFIVSFTGQDKRFEISGELKGLSNKEMLRLPKSIGSFISCNYVA